MRAAPVTAFTLTLAASFAILVRVLSSAYVDGWAGIGAAAIVAAAVAAFGLHAWDLATGRGWRQALQGELMTDRLAALDRLLSEGRIHRADYLEERRRLLRGP